MTPPKLDQKAWDSLFDRMIATTDRVIAMQKGWIKHPCGKHKVRFQLECVDCIRNESHLLGTCPQCPVAVPEPSLDDGLTEQAFSEYEASILTSPHPPACSCSRCSDARRYDANLEWQDEE